MANFIVEAQKAYGGLLPYVNTIQTDTGNPINIPDADFTSFVASVSSSATTGSAFAPFGQVTLGAHLYRTDVIPIDMTLIQDSAFDIQSYVGKILGMGLARGENNDITVGDDSGNQPLGIVTAVSPAVSSSTYSYVNLLSLIAALDPAYYQNARWCMHNTTFLALASLTDSNGRPLIWNQLQSLPDAPFSQNLLGFPVVINQNMPTADTHNGTTILFGDYSYYQLRRASQVILVRYMETFRQTYNAIGLEAQERVDGTLVGVGSNGPVVGFEFTASSGTYP